MKLSFDRLVTLVLVSCAISMTVLVARHEYLNEDSRQTSVQKPRYVPDWKSHLDQGVLLGRTNAPVQLIELADFECPFCATFHKTLTALRARYPTQVSLTYVHFPLSGHRFAIPAAQAAECAGEQGKFEAMHDALFEQQQSFGLKPWTDVARIAGVSDLLAFDACTKREGQSPRIQAGQRLAADLGAKGTPTLLVNGWMLGGPPSLDKLQSMVSTLLSGKYLSAKDLQ
jgi:protein-disulfide isomerase